MTYAKDEAGREAFLEGYEAAQADAKICHLPPHGWRCTRTAGHDGPCAAVESPEDIELVASAMNRLRSATPPAAQPAPTQEPAGMNRTDKQPDDDFEFSPIIKAWVQARSEFPSPPSCEIELANRRFFEALARFAELMAQPAPSPIKPVVDPDLDINQRLAFKLGWKSAEEAHGITEGQQ